MFSKGSDHVKKMFLIRRKGFNYYTDYTELYLHRSFENNGYHLVKDESKCLFDVMVDISEEKYMAVFSPYFDTLSEDDAREFATLLSTNFKSEVIVMPCPRNYQCKGVPYKFMFSDIYNAFEEDVYVYDQEPEFVRESKTYACKSELLYSEEYVNYGGGCKGIEISISFDEEDVEIEGAFIIYQRKKEIERQQISFIKKNNQFVCTLTDFYFEKGINKYSAVLRGRKLQNEKWKHGFSIHFIPKSNAERMVPKVCIKER